MEDFDRPLNQTSPVTTQPEHAAVLREALDIVGQRGDERGEVWTRSGLRGQTVMMFSKAERAMNEVMAGRIPSRDHYIDLINYAAFAVRLMDAGSGKVLEDVLDGQWIWR